MKDEDETTSYCPQCERSKFLDCFGLCDGCGFDFTNGMDKEEWIERARNYLELIKVLASSIYEVEKLQQEAWEIFSDDKDFAPHLPKLLAAKMKFPIAQGFNNRANLKKIHNHVEALSFDKEAAAQALKDVAEILTKGDEK